MKRIDNNLFENDPEVYLLVSELTLHNAFVSWHEELEHKRKESENQTLIPAKVAQAKLGVDRSTLYRWDKEGYLPIIKRGSRNWYNLKDVETIINGEAKED